eukprot:5921918-Prymnesium_polylepis.1
MAVTYSVPPPLLKVRRRRDSSRGWSDPVTGRIPWLVGSRGWSDPVAGRIPWLAGSRGWPDPENGWSDPVAGGIPWL